MHTTPECAQDESRWSACTWTPLPGRSDAISCQPCVGMLPKPKQCIEEGKQKTLRRKITVSSAGRCACSDSIGADRGKGSDGDVRKNIKETLPNEQGHEPIDLPPLCHTGTSEVVTLRILKDREDAPCIAASWVMCKNGKYIRPNRWGGLHHAKRKVRVLFSFEDNESELRRNSQSAAPMKKMNTLGKPRQRG